MAARILEANQGPVDLRIYNVERDLIYLPPEGRSLFELLEPITDASHTRDRKRSPPDSACLPGTRKVVIKWIISWVTSSLLIKRQHILWVYGYAGCGKSAIAQEISEQVQGGGHLLATFFFFRNEGDRSKIGRLPNTLASQMATSLPETAVLIEAAVKAEPGLLQVESPFSLGARLQRLVYEPFKAIADQTSLAKSFLSKPYLIIIDGLDECDDKEGVQEFITTTLRFFDTNPFILLRILITSRVEQHIHSLLTADGGVRLKNLADHCSREDVENFMDTVFNARTKGDPVIQAHMRQNGSWPNPADSQKLVDHIGGSFIFASTLFRFIFDPPTAPGDYSTPLDRFPLALNIEPGLDGLYSQTLERSEHLPYFTEIISTLALLARPLPISAIAELLDIQASAVARVLVDLQAIIQVPGTDDVPVAFYHTSLRDFLTTESRSGRFFVPPSFHADLLVHCVSCELRALRQSPKDQLDRREQTAAVQYSLEHREITHWNHASPIFRFIDLDKLIQSRRKIAGAVPASDRAAGFDYLACELLLLSHHDGLASTIDLIILMHRKALSLRPHPHPTRSQSLNNLGYTLRLLFEHNRCVSHVEEAILFLREALSLRPPPHPHRSGSLSNLGNALLSLFEHSQCVSHVEEAILLYREALDLRPHPHRDRHYSLNYLGNALRSLFEHNRCISHLEEAISMHCEALGLPRLRAHRHPSLRYLSAALYDRFNELQSVEDLDEAISLCREAFAVPHSSRPDTLSALTRYLRARYDVNQSIEDLEEAIACSRELVVKHYLEGHKCRDQTMGKLQSLLQLRFEATGKQGDLDDWIGNLDGEREE